MRFFALLTAGLVLTLTTDAQSMHGPESHYAPLDSAAVFAEYSNSSSHIVLGETRQRKFAGLALAYQRRISASHGMSWAYSAEVRPILVESDPTLRGFRDVSTIGGKTYVNDRRFVQQLPIQDPNSRVYKNETLSGVLPDGTPFTATFQSFLGRRWTYAPGITPACFSVHLLPQYRLQPFLASTGGFIVSPRDIPQFKTSAFNFTFSFGGGVEWFRDRRPWIVEYRVQHMSNKQIGTMNPGVDSQFLRVGYRFGF